MKASYFSCKNRFSFVYLYMHTPYTSSTLPFIYKVHRYCTWESIILKCLIFICPSFLHIFIYYRRARKMGTHLLYLEILIINNFTSVAISFPLLYGPFVPPVSSRPLILFKLVIELNRWSLVWSACFFVYMISPRCFYLFWIKIRRSGIF